MKRSYASAVTVKLTPGIYCRRKYGLPHRRIRIRTSRVRSMTRLGSWRATVLRQNG